MSWIREISSLLETIAESDMFLLIFMYCCLAMAEIIIDYICWLLFRFRTPPCCLDSMIITSSCIQCGVILSYLSLVHTDGVNRVNGVKSIISVIEKC